MSTNRGKSADGPSLQVPAATSGTTAFRPLDTVRVARLTRAPRDHVVGAPRRVPRIGDIGRIVETVPSPGGTGRYLIEAVDDHGTVAWQGVFDAAELALADGAM